MKKIVLPLESLVSVGPYEWRLTSAWLIQHIFKLFSVNSEAGSSLQDCRSCIMSAKKRLKCFVYLPWKLWTKISFYHYVFPLTCLVYVIYSGKLIIYILLNTFHHYCYHCVCLFCVDFYKLDQKNPFIHAVRSTLSCMYRLILLIKGFTRHSCSLWLLFWFLPKYN